MRKPVKNMAGETLLTLDVKLSVAIGVAIDESAPLTRDGIAELTRDYLRQLTVAELRGFVIDSVSVIDPVHTDLLDREGGHPLGEWQSFRDSSTRANPTITVTVWGGSVQDVCGLRPGATVYIHDYDVDCCDDSELETDDEGEKYVLTVYRGGESA